jgi:hypothetical protein
MAVLRNSESLLLPHSTPKGGLREWDASTCNSKEMWRMWKRGEAAGPGKIAGAMHLLTIVVITSIMLLSNPGGGP